MTEFYKKYFLELAKRHVSIQHTEEQPAFFYIKDKYNPTAFDNAIKNAGKTHVLLLERYTHDVDDNANRNYFRHLHGRFTIVILAVNGDQATIDEAQDQAEKISLSILVKMRTDLENGGIIELESGAQQKVFFKVSKVPVDPVGPMLQKYYGVSVGFEWRCPFQGAVNDADWVNI